MPPLYVFKCKHCDYEQNVTHYTMCQWREWRDRRFEWLEERVKQLEKELDQLKQKQQ